MAATGMLFPEARTDDRQDYFAGLGVLPDHVLRQLIRDRAITAATAVLDEQVQPASLDLRLGTVAYRVRTSFLPGAAPVARKIEQLAMHSMDLGDGAVLEKGCVYIVPLQEELDLPKAIGGTANPKSTTGRLDIFTRLITDGATEFEVVPAGYRGQLYLEISPRTFSILVRAGDRLNQLRLRRGVQRHPDTILERLQDKEPLVFLSGDEAAKANISKGLWLRIDLKGEHGHELIGYRAKPHTPLIDLRRIRHYEPDDFWEPIRRNRTASLILNPGDFYILVSKEKVSIPPDHAAEMVAYDPSVGEFRIHYAGFFDPGFGYGDTRSGTPAVLEVRSHEVPFLLEDGQVVGRLVFEKLLQPPQQLYGSAIGSSYAVQGLALSKHFKLT
ncbi:MAG TPA: 2'-deoxycytidine 5'-triphosphate deaminase [Candidatus Sulfotelmatobacter sp.]|nr:2'-deoxycytidine 5'-triphosphate deaminase [Candidatus Sulfotelmatobacter sp.]